MSQALAELGANLLLVDLDAERTAKLEDSLESALGIRAVAATAELEDESALRALPHIAQDRLGRLMILVNNAAFVGTSGLTGWAVPFEKQSSDTWCRALEVSLTVCFARSQEAAPLLAQTDKGYIINIGSIYGVYAPVPSLYEGTDMHSPAAYAASKGGLLQLTRWLSTVLGLQTRVNAIFPCGAALGQPEAFVDRYVERTPLKRMAQEEYFMGAIAYLTSSISAYVTGLTIMVDDGWGVW